MTNGTLGRTGMPRWMAAISVGVLALAACASARSADPSPTVATVATPAVGISVVPTTAPVSVPPTTLPATTVPPTTVPATTLPPTTVPPTTVPPTTVPATTPYGMPVADGQHAGYQHVHHDYPASDTFVPAGCGSPIIAPVNGTVLETRREDAWVATVDNPATRGGKSISILGDEGVRYYFAHLSAIDDTIQPGVHVTIGQQLGLMGRTGKAGACHVHFAISPPCPGKEWAVRRGVIWPWPYLDAWKRGEQLSPLPEIEQWVAAHPTACADAMADPNAADS